ncbi:MULTISPECIES: AlpA family transcriptional regulator [unclassified Serratia (in: enterobacteria)]|uniref:helix-turn-helix transcriptional regulator n=1 Tax=unclassified Serratia (in: enterobacteria) TaxID=2647522 RepID=UPI000907547C|nr:MULTISPECIES: AlpA family transcriptional regulator [unclassified Serratia (in: enterobacteria)]
MNEQLNLIEEKEVMQRLKVSSRQTIYTYQKKFGFPMPIRTHPKAYLEEAVVKWILNGGVNPKVTS